MRAAWVCGAAWKDTLLVEVALHLSRIKNRLAAGDKAEQPSAWTFGNAISLADLAGIESGHHNQATARCGPKGMRIEVQPGKAFGRNDRPARE